MIKICMNANILIKTKFFHKTIYYQNCFTLIISDLITTLITFIWAVVTLLFVSRVIATFVVRRVV